MGKPKTAEELAEVMGVHLATVHRWERKEGFPRKKRGCYDTEAISAWRTVMNKVAKGTAAHVPKVTGGKLETEADRMAREERGEKDWTDEYRKWKAEKEKIAVRELRKRLMPVERVERRVAGQIQVVRSGGH